REVSEASVCRILKAADAFANPTTAHAFGYACAKADIDHRPTPQLDRFILDPTHQMPGLNTPRPSSVAGGPTTDAPCGTKATACRNRTARDNRLHLWWGKTARHDAQDQTSRRRPCRRRLPAQFHRLQAD